MSINHEMNQFDCIFHGWINPMRILETFLEGSKLKWANFTGKLRHFDGKLGKIADFCVNRN